MARASMVLPAPGGPTMQTLCPLAAATAMASIAESWPRIAAKGEGNVVDIHQCGEVVASGDGKRTGKVVQDVRQVGCRVHRNSGQQGGLGRRICGLHDAIEAVVGANLGQGRAPRIERICPSRASSPMHSSRSNGVITCSEAARMPKARGS